MTKYNVGIIGNGFVGQALAYGFSPVPKIRIYDLDPLKCVDEFKETVNKAKALLKALE